LKASRRVRVVKGRRNRKKFMFLEDRLIHSAFGIGPVQFSPFFLSSSSTEPTRPLTKRNSTHLLTPAPRPNGRRPRMAANKHRQIDRWIEKKTDRTGRQRDPLWIDLSLFSSSPPLSLFFPIPSTEPPFSWKNGKEVNESVWVRKEKEKRVPSY